MREIKFTISFRVPDLNRIGILCESDTEVKNRTLKLHQKYSAKRKKLDLEFKRKKVNVTKYHHAMQQLSQDQFAYSFFAGWKKVFLTLDGKKKTVLAVIPS